MDSKFEESLIQQRDHSNTDYYTVDVSYSPPLLKFTEAPVDSDSSWFALLANRLHFSRAYVAFYILMIILNVFLFVTGIIQAKNAHDWEYDDQDWYFALDCVASFFLILEVCIRWYATHHTNHFWNWLNFFDIVVVVLILVELIYYIASKNLLIFGSLFIAIRCIVQCIRVVTLIIHTQQQRTEVLAADKPIDFSQIIDTED